jgi:hypothetical protein
MINKSESITKLASALIGFQTDVSAIKKDSSNPFFKSKYASLSQVLDGIKKPLIDNKLAVVQFPRGEHELVTIILHESGEYLEESYKMTPSKNDPQGLGSAITYQRRYALCSCLGLNIEEDDDGNAASQPVANGAPKKSVGGLLNGKQIEIIECAKSIWKVNAQEELTKYLLTKFNVKSVAELSTDKLDMALNLMLDKRIEAESK